MAQLSPLQAFGKLCSLAMLTTARVGDVEEDPSMSQARPRLAAINERGLVTTDSQMGPRTTFQDVRWIRSVALAKFEKRLNVVDGVSFFIGVPGPSPPHEQIYHIPEWQRAPSDPSNFYQKFKQSCKTQPASISSNKILSKLKLWTPSGEGPGGCLIKLPRSLTKFSK
ncbi:unnamed protein product, partial [Pylaiella littoralis]